MNILTITNSEGTAVVSLHIGDIEPAKATMVILEALKTVRAPRSDKGRRKKKAPAQPEERTI